jgi:hypothetical protein
MRISGANANTTVAGTPAARRAAPGGFSPAEATTARATGAPVALRTVGGIEALIALQGLEDPAERRKRGL